MPRAKNIIELFAVTFGDKEVPVHFPHRCRSLVCKAMGEVSRGVKIIVRCDNPKAVAVEDVQDRLLGNDYKNVEVRQR